MFQTQSLSPYGQCQHCGYKLIQSQTHYPDNTNTEMIRLSEIVSAQSRRIAELEAELESLKNSTKTKWVKSYIKICANTTEEGEG